MINRELHERLIARQSTAELKRKADKARERRGKLWTQEEIDYINRRAAEMSQRLKGLIRHGKYDE